MPRRPAADPPAYRQQIFALARADPTANELAQEVESVHRRDVRRRSRSRRMPHVRR